MYFPNLYGIISYMAIRKIFTFRDPELRKKAERVDNIDGDIQKLVQDMFETMYKAPGIGLAAPQIGVSKRVIVMDVSDDANSPIALINPQIVESHGKVSSEEGCLSLSDYRDTITRNASVLVKGINIEGEEVLFEAEDLLARCAQHEIDHLDGVLYIERKKL